MNAQRKPQSLHLSARAGQVINRSKTIMAIEHARTPGKNRTMPVLKLNFADPGRYSIVNHASHSSHTSHASHHSRHR